MLKSLLLSALITLAPITIANAKQPTVYAYACTESSPTVNGRSGPGLNYPVIRQVPINQKFLVIEGHIDQTITEVWVRLRVGNVLVWVNSDYICYYH